MPVIESTAIEDAIASLVDAAISGEFIALRQALEDAREHLKPYQVPMVVSKAVRRLDKAMDYEPAKWLSVLWQGFYEDC